MWCTLKVNCSEKYVKHIRSQWGGGESCWISTLVWTGKYVRHERMPNHLLKMKMINLQKTECNETLKMLKVLTVSVTQ